MALFESYERRIDQINSVLNSYGISSIEEAEKITKDAGLDVYEQVKKIQPICFENSERRKVALAPALHNHPLLSMMSPLNSTSTPWLLMHPTFRNVEENPVTIEMGTSWSRFFESRLKYSTVPRRRWPKKPKSIPTFVL